MAVYFVTGKLGSGKTLVAVKRLQEYIRAGRRVATNLDLDIDKLCPDNADKTLHVVRLPDKPTAFDMEMIGLGYEGEEYNEERFGICVLDELGTWLNSRSWNDKDRKKFLDWCIHARKLRWDIIFIVQNVAMVDAQLRDALCEHLVNCKRADRVKIMGVRLPKVHVGVVYYGATANSSMKLEKWVYRGRDLYGAYDTAQAFSPFYDKGCYCPLVPKFFDAPQTEVNAQDEINSKRKGLGNASKLAAAACIGGASVALATNAYDSADSSTAAQETPQTAMEIIEEKQATTNWLAGLGIVHYEGELKTDATTTFYFRSDTIGPFDSSYLNRIGARVETIGECGVTIFWPDNQVAVINCYINNLEI